MLLFPTLSENLIVKSLHPKTPRTSICQDDQKRHNVLLDYLRILFFQELYSFTEFIDPQLFAAS